MLAACAGVIIAVGVHVAGFASLGMDLPYVTDLIWRLTPGIAAFGGWWLTPRAVAARAFPWRLATASGVIAVVLGAFALPLAVLVTDWRQLGITELTFASGLSGVVVSAIVGLFLLGPAMLAITLVAAFLWVALVRRFAPRPPPKPDATPRAS